jgi:hypothetical protein
MEEHPEQALPLRCHRGITVTYILRSTKPNCCDLRTSAVLLDNSTLSLLELTGMKPAFCSP